MENEEGKREGIEMEAEECNDRRNEEEKRKELRKERTKEGRKEGRTREPTNYVKAIFVLWRAVVT